MTCVESKISFALRGEMNNTTTAYDHLMCEGDVHELMHKASSVRDDHWGNEITYSRKIFVPLTNMCRDTCGYCTFVKHPDSPEAQIMSPDQVLRVAREGQKHGCKEVLFSLGEKPELRYERARTALRLLGFGSMIQYVREMCELVLKETSLLPHVNAGTMTENDFILLKPVAASMGMMLETSSKRLTQRGHAHFACPDKVPIQRLRTLERAGLNKVPFTTGLLIGIGETREERIQALHDINNSHLKYGHIQEVIIQNFVPKPNIAMADHPEPKLEEMLWTIAIARLILDPTISLQAPPNLSERHIQYLRAGINDWGGISPLTIDFINPERDWPEINALAKSTFDAGFSLKERLTVYPSYQKALGTFLSLDIHRRIVELSRRDGLALDQRIA